MHRAPTPAPTAPAHTTATSLPADELQALLETASDIFGRGSTEGAVEWVSPSVTALLGWAPDELVGHRFLGFVHPDDHDIVRDVQRQLTDGDAARMEIRVRTSTGSHRWMSIRIRPIVDDDGTTVGRVAAWRDIQDEVDARTAERAAMDALRTTIDSMPDPYVVATACRAADGTPIDFEITEANTAACRFMGWPCPLLPGIRVMAIFPTEPATRYVRLAARVLRTGEALVADRAAICNGPNGELRYYDARGARIDADRVGFTWREVTDQVEHERALAALAALEAVADERERVARDLHDGAIQHVYATGMLLQAISARAPDRIRTELERIIAEQELIVGELRATIRDLLRPDFADLPASTRLVRAVDEAARSLGFHPSLAGHEALDTLDDPALLQHLLYATREMLSNVARHAAAHEVDVTVMIDPSNVTVEVADDGVGVGPGGRAGERSPTPSGFGLTNLQRRAQVLGGSFELSAREPTGTLARWSVRR